MKVIIISGPTASGKTETSLTLAHQLGGEVVNFDSLLLYKELNIGTAKPSLKERGTIPHHMIDVASISHPMNASDYLKMALPIVNQIINKNQVVYLVGGSGFYLQALLKGMYDSPSTPSDIIQRSEQLYQGQGIKPFIEMLKLHDPGSYNRYHENDHYRIRRAVEHFWSHGTPLSLVRQQKDQENQHLTSTNIHGWDILHLNLDLPKEEHFKIIQNRTDRMLQEGLIKEVDELLKAGFSGTEKPLQSIGYKEVLDLKFGVIKNLDECRERINISTRQLAKSQRTWFNRDTSKHKFHPLLNAQKILTQVCDFIHLKTQ